MNETFQLLTFLYYSRNNFLSYFHMINIDLMVVRNSMFQYFQVLQNNFEVILCNLDVL